MTNTLYDGHPMDLLTAKDIWRPLGLPAPRSVYTLLALPRVTLSPGRIRFRRRDVIEFLTAKTQTYIAPRPPARVRNISRTREARAIVDEFNRTGRRA